MPRDKFKLGDRLRDTVTDFEGTATARYEYLNGCVRYQVERGKKDGGIEELVFDEQRLEKTQAPALAATVRRTGGAQNTPPRTGAR